MVLEGEFRRRIRRRICFAHDAHPALTLKNSLGARMGQSAKFKPPHPRRAAQPTGR
jgi:hypothetical protein